MFVPVSSDIVSASGTLWSVCHSSCATTVPAAGAKIKVPSRSLRAVPINPCPASTVCPGATSMVPLARFVRSTVPLHFARSPCRVPAAISGRARAGAASTTSRPFSKFRLAHENSPLSSREYSPVRSSSSVTAVPGCKPQLRSTAPARARCPVVRLP